MEESSSHRRTFTVGLKPAHQLLRSLMVTTEIGSSAVLIVKNGEIQISATSPDLDAYGSLMMEASTAASWTSECYAIQFDPAVWIQLFRSSIDQHQTKSLWVYKIGRYPDLYCLVGENSHMLLSMLVKHLDHKNVVKQPLKQINILTVTMHLSQYAKQQVSVAITGALTDLMKHLRKCMQYSAEASSRGNGAYKLNTNLQSAIEQCILALSKKS